MPAPNINRSDDPWPYYRGKEQVTVGADDIDFASPVTVRALVAGDLAYEDALGNSHTDTLAAGSDVVGPGDGLVGVRRILGATTITSVLVGIV